jgi:hypothetical protein
MIAVVKPLHQPKYRLSAPERKEFGVAKASRFERLQTAIKALNPQSRCKPVSRPNAKRA